MKVIVRAVIVIMETIYVVVLVWKWRLNRCITAFSPHSELQTYPDLFEEVSSVDVPIWY